MKAGRKVELLKGPTHADVDEILRNPAVSDICLIGEGSLGNLYITTEKEVKNSGKAYDWKKVAKTADHLKQGGIYQRFCSVSNNSDVPWGLFAAQRPSGVWVSRETYFVPETVHNRADQGLIPVTARTELTLDVIEAIREKSRCKSWK